MQTHPYLRAYMAGITIPTMFLLVFMTAFTFGRYVYDVAAPIERVIVFPMAVVPNLWGLWNILHVRLRPRVTIGVWGALLPLLIAPSAYAVARLTQFEIPLIISQGFPIGFPIGMAVYYLVWKHVIGYFNAVLGIE